MPSLVARSKMLHARLLGRLRGGELSPRRLAGSVALGLFIGILPLYGAHLPLCAFFGLLFRLDVLITYVAANVSIPPMIPVLLYGGLQLGAWTLTGRFRELSLDQVRPDSWLAIGTELMVGSLELASLSALVGGSLAYVLARAVMEPSAADDSEHKQLALGIARTSSRYHTAPRAHRYYVSSKLRVDPLTRELHAAVRRGEIFGDLLDAGAGRGQFSLFLADLGVISSIRGFDHDVQKIQVARRAAEPVGLMAQFDVGDLRTTPLPPADTILLLDVLHYLSVPEQDVVLNRVVEALRPGGRLFLRETNRGAGLGAVVAAWLEKAARVLGINRGERLMFRAPAEYARHLVGLGLTVEQAPGRGALDNVLVVAKKAGGAG